MDNLKRYKFTIENLNDIDIKEIKDNQYFIGINFREDRQIIVYVNNVVKEIDIIDTKNFKFNQILSILLQIYPEHNVIPLRPALRFGFYINYDDYLENRINNVNLTSTKLLNYLEIDYLKSHKITTEQNMKSEQVLESERRLTNTNPQGNGFILCYSNLYYPQSYQFLPDNIRYYFVNNHKNLNPDIVSNIMDLNFDNQINYIIIKNNYCNIDITDDIITKLYKVLKSNGILFIQNAKDININSKLFKRLNKEDVNKSFFVKEPKGDDYLLLMKKEKIRKSNPYDVYSKKIIENICRFQDGSVDQQILMSLKSMSKEDKSEIIPKKSKVFEYYYIQQQLMDDYGVSKEYVDFVFSWFKKYYKIINSNTCPKLYYYAELVSEEQVNKYKDMILNYFDSNQFKIVRMILGLMLLN
jgi:hypothetical protein